MKASTEHDPLRVMSFNVLVAYRLNVFKPWRWRRDAAAELIRSSGADLIGLQEPLRRQVDDLADRLGRHEWFGAGRLDGRFRGEFNPIFYRRSRLKLLDGDIFWLSRTPEKPSRSWGAMRARIATWAKFRDRRTKEELFHFNVHFDHASWRHRTRSAQLLLDRVEQIAGQGSVVVTGDLNATMRSRAYRILTGGESGRHRAATALGDARELSKEAHLGPLGTYRGAGPPHKTRLRLDYIMVTPGVKVLRHQAVLGSPPPRRFPSDHLPVLAELLLPRHRRRAH